MKTVFLNIPALNGQQLSVNVPENTIQIKDQPLPKIVVEAIWSLPTKNPWLDPEVRRSFANELARVLLDENVCRPTVSGMFLNEFFEVAVTKHHTPSTFSYMTPTELMSEVVLWVLVEQLKAINGPSLYRVYSKVYIDVCFDISAKNSEDIEELAVAFVENEFKGVGGFEDFIMDVGIDSVKKLV